MGYPNFKDKHIEEALFGPKDAPSFKKLPLNFPKKHILLYDRKLMSRIKNKYKLKKILKLSKSMMDFYWHGDVGIIYMKGIGSPHAVAVFEDIISHGGKIFLNIGSAGGLQKQGSFLCIQALRDEGTSYHYIPHGKYSYPDENLTKRLGKYLKKNEIPYKEGTTWTIDAPYRETKAEIKKYTKDGISTVEMEASALFAVAKARDVKIASAFFVSDILGDTWENKFATHSFKHGIDRLFDAALECLRDLK